MSAEAERQVAVARVETVDEQHLTLALPDGARHLMPLSNLLAVSDTERTARVASLAGADIPVVIDTVGPTVEVRELGAPLNFTTPKDVTLVAIAALRARLGVLDTRLDHFHRQLWRASDDVCLAMGQAARLLREKDTNTTDAYAVGYNCLSAGVLSYIAKYEPQVAALESAKTAT